MAQAAKRSSPPPLHATAAAVFDRLLDDIVSGVYGPGARLPAERDLARSLGASRPTLREALRRLGERGLIDARRGSGVAVRPRRDWSIEVLPAFLEASARTAPSALAPLVRDLLTLRRGLLVEVLRIVGGRLAPGSLASARTHAQAAWEARGSVADFVREDFEVLRAIVEAADFLPALWLLGTLSGTYRALATGLTAGATVPSDYLRSYRAVFDALESHQVDAACAALSGYLARHDRRLLPGATP